MKPRSSERSRGGGAAVGGMLGGGKGGGKGGGEGGGRGGHQFTRSAQFFRNLQQQQGQQGKGAKRGAVEEGGPPAAKAARFKL